MLQLFIFVCIEVGFQYHVHQTKLFYLGDDEEEHTTEDTSTTTTTIIDDAAAATPPNGDAVTTIEYH